MMSLKTKMMLVMIPLVGLTACGVPKQEHFAVLKDFENTKVELAESQREKAAYEKQTEETLEELSNHLNALTDKFNKLSVALEEARATISLYESKTGTLEDALQASQAELDDLRQARIQAERRMLMYQDLATRLASMIEAGQLTVKIRDGKMMIELNDSILFDPGRTDIKPQGSEALRALAEVLRDIERRNFLVAGHTDNVPIRSARFRSNWELSTARAVEVVKFLEDAGVAPTQLAAAGYGEFDPVAENDSPEGRALNRRIEIILMPNIEEMPSVSDFVVEES